MPQKKLIVLVDLPTDPTELAELNDVLDKLKGQGYSIEIGEHPKPRA